MKNKTFYFIACLFLFSISFSGCKKNKGCTDKDSPNYNSNATEDDGSCGYSAFIVFWYNQQTATNLASAGYSNIKCTIDGSVVGTSPSSVHFATEPTCGQSGSLSITQSLGNNKSQSVNYVITDASSGNVIWSGSLGLNNNVCIKKYLVF